MTLQMTIISYRVTQYEIMVIWSDEIEKWGGCLKILYCQKELEAIQSRYAPPAEYRHVMYFQLKKKNTILCCVVIC